MGILRITVDHTVRITAESARVHVLVRGSSSLSGDVAAKKAAVVREIVADLATLGVPEDAIEVTGVRLATREGKLLNTSSVEIQLVVTAAADQLPDVLGALAARAGVSVDHLEWVFRDFEASIPATADAMTMARRKADAVAAAAGLEVTGIENASDSWSMPMPRAELAAQSDMMFAARSAKASEPLDLGIELNATSELSVHLSVDFALSS
ncbi:MAG: SIMPL domain-containing protein [Actinobacteria bacterium]|nr:SIMPL domain-containing protein [Actinomycetota bacterium]